MLIYSHANPFKPCPLPSLMPVFSGHTCLIPYKENRYSLIYMHFPSLLSSQSFIHFRRWVKCLSSLSPKLVSLQVLAPFCSWSSNIARLATALSSASLFLSSQRVVFLLAREPPAPILNNKLKHTKREHQQAEENSKSTSLLSYCCFSASVFESTMSVCTIPHFPVTCQHSSLISVLFLHWNKVRQPPRELFFVPSHFTSLLGEPAVIPSKPWACCGPETVFLCCFFSPVAIAITNLCWLLLYVIPIVWVLRALK